MHNDLYLWTSSAGDDVVIKLYVKTDRNRVEREWAALTLLAPHGLTTVPAPLWLDHTPAEPAIGMSRLHGQPLLEATDKMAALRALAHTTARLQTVRLTGLLATLPRIDTGEHYMIRLTQTWPQMLASQADDSLAPAMRKLLTTWQRSGDADLVTTPTTPVLSRGDANLLNWMITDTGAGCVDFEYAGYSTVPFDAADSSSTSPAGPSRTTSGPGAARPRHHRCNRRQFAANQRTCALRWLAVLWKQRDHRRADFDTQHARVEMLHSNDNPYT